MSQQSSLASLVLLGLLLGGCVSETAHPVSVEPSLPPIEIPHYQVDPVPDDDPELTARLTALYADRVAIIESLMDRTKTGWPDRVWPRLISAVRPALSAAVRAAHKQGYVKVVFVVKQDGSVADARILEGADTELDAAALVAVGAWRFHPATSYNRRVESLMMTTIECR